MFKAFAWLCGGLLACLALSFSPALAEDAFYSVSLNDLKITEGNLSQLEADSGKMNWDFRRQPLQAYVVLDGPGEAFLTGYSPYTPLTGSAARLVARAPAGKEVAGLLVAPKSGKAEMGKLRFKIPADAAKEEDQKAFYEAKMVHYGELAVRRSPGGAWFRHQSLEAAAKLNLDKVARDRAQIGFINFATNDDPFDLFSGGRAISENLQLDRALPVPQANGESDLVKLDSIEGITVKEMDWTAKLKELKEPIELDPLAHFLPADQHVIFFADFPAFMRVLDEINVSGTPVMRLNESRAEDLDARRFYEQQLGLTLTGLGRIIGPRVIQSVALTGSDLNFRTGTDLAILFQTTDAEQLKTLLLAQIKLSVASNPDAKPVQGDVGGLAYEGYRSPDRHVSVYVAKLDGAVVVANSLYDLQQIVAVKQGKIKAVDKLDEYRFFRGRYRRGEGQEAALLFLSDATIRRWCGPRWRIASARQLRDLGVLCSLEATYLDKIVTGKVAPGPIHTDLAFSPIDDLSLGAEGVRSAELGSLEFMTPIAETPLKQVTKAESEAYTRWRAGYEMNWRWAFDPIALRLTVDEKQLGADLTVMPLIAGSDYREMISVSKGAKLKPDSGDLHDSLAHLIIAFNPNSESVRRQANMASMLTPGADPLSWIGGSIALYADDDPYWKELAAIDFNDEKAVEAFMEKNLSRLPVALRIEVANSLKAVAFITILHAFVDQSAPGMTHWEALKHGEQAYVKITPNDSARKDFGLAEGLSLYYALNSDAITFTLNESVLFRALDRQAQRQKAKDSKEGLPATSHPWIGDNVGMQIGSALVGFYRGLVGRQYQLEIQRQAWENLPILNEWKRLYPDLDPVAVHEKVWKTRLICPGGGKYVWNNDWKTMESTVYGHPGAPKVATELPLLLKNLTQADFGLSFEDDGLRARGMLTRRPADGK